MWQRGEDALSTKGNALSAVGCFGSAMWSSGPGQRSRLLPTFRETGIGLRYLHRGVRTAEFVPHWAAGTYGRGEHTFQTRWAL